MLEEQNVVGRARAGVHDYTAVRSLSPEPWQWGSVPKFSGFLLLKSWIVPSGTHGGASWGALHDIAAPHLQRVTGTQSNVMTLGCNHTHALNSLHNLCVHHRPHRVM